MTPSTVSTSCAYRTRYYHMLCYTCREMAYRNKTYVVFDADNDGWAYRYMKGWDALPTVPFGFADAHNLGPELTGRAHEPTVKRALRLRFSNAKNVVVLIGQKTRFLYRYVRWELDVALQFDLPIIAVNLNRKRAIDNELCPPVIRDEYVVHIPFKLAIIKYALGQFPAQHAQRGLGARGPLYYSDRVYQDLGLNPNPVSPPLQPIGPPPYRSDFAPSSTSLPSLSGQTLGRLWGHISAFPSGPAPSIPPPSPYNSLASLLSVAPVTPPLQKNRLVSNLFESEKNVPPPPIDWFKKLTG